MLDDSRSFIGRAFLQSIYDIEFRAYLAEGRDAEVLAVLKAWDDRLRLSETQAESAFIQTFFVELWGFGEAGRVRREEHSAIPKFAVPGAGSSGGQGEADLALGWFRGGLAAEPQVLCEFKDIRSGLDAKQNRKGANLTPVEQCLNYVRHARRNLFGNEAVQPWWGLVTDMNEFRLYWWDRAPRECLAFHIRRKDLLTPYDLLSNGSDAEFDRFLFTKLFQRDMLISLSGKPALWRLVERQWLREDRLENEFYDHYRKLRERLFGVLRTHNPKIAATPTELLRATQKLLDRFIFAFYCEDMGERMLFPPQFIRDYLKTRSVEPYYDTIGTEIWAFFRRLFKTMNTGGRLGQTAVPHINGGLFDEDALIEELEIPNHVFAAAGQGHNEASLEQDQETLFYLCARYNYAAKGSAKDSLSLYTLGRIFEQSITELEYRIGELENRETLAKLSKRKRDGVYYTPEWVVNYLVEETLVPWFDAARKVAGFAPDGTPPDLAAAVAYEDRLCRIRIVDPACGSGAFLISAFRKLLDERVKARRDIERLSARGMAEAIDEKPIIAEILVNNIYGVDINPSSVEIAKLALWLHSARASAPLSSLDHTIRCGNSLVGPDIWSMREATPEAISRINPFDWQAAFPEAFADGGFDIVLGNPPYVKLQNLRKVDPDVVAYLVGQRGPDTYLSTQTGNFDLYLPFIEKGLRLLAPGGRMAYIAPSLWPVNEYGAGLCGLLHRTRQLERWVDFKSYQVFDEATTYTALQFFTHSPNDTLGIVVSPDGNIGDIDWADESLRLQASEFSAEGGWLMATGEERALILRLRRDCLRLDDRFLTDGITVGIQTSADAIYHLQRLGPNRYRCSPPKQQSFEVQIEDGVMRPLVSGPEAKRYEECQTGTFLLFPYEADERGDVRLIDEADLARRFPEAYAHLKNHETILRAREQSGFDDSRWYRFGRHQNLDKQEVEKLIVAQTVPGMRVCADYTADKYLNNVRVNGILPARGCDLSYLLGVLNGPVADFVFRRIAKPKQGGWFEANRQFIAPLPIPRADHDVQAEIGTMARSLQEAWTRRRSLLAEAADRLAVLGRGRRGARWLWPELPELGALKEAAPKKLRASEKTEWAQQRLDELEDARVAELQGALDGGGRLSASYSGGELRLYAQGEVLLGRIYLDAPQGALTEAYWRFLLLGKTQRDGGRFAIELRRVPDAPESPAARQFVERIGELVTVTEAIRESERRLNERLYQLYELSAEERLLVERDCARRALI